LNFGIGADGLLVIADNNDPTINAKYFMKVFNKDGSMANMCGNGLRCFCACLKQFGFE
jgi:diaminopimelate epimerase